MKEYVYFPGCSLEKMVVSYHMSAMETTRKLGIKLHEIEAFQKFRMNDSKIISTVLCYHSRSDIACKLVAQALPFLNFGDYHFDYLKNFTSLFFA